MDLRLLRKAKAVQRVYGKNTVILRSGDRVYSLLKIESGIVLIYNESRSRIVNVLAQGDYLADAEFHLGLEFPLEAIALNTVEISRQDNRDGKEILYQCYESYNNVVRILNTHGMNAKQKAIAGLLWFCDKAKLPATNNQVNNIPLNDCILSDITGMTRETCTRAIAPLVKEGVIKRNNGKSISILGLERLTFLSSK